jgi:broad specificity phosphatase PhoE
MAIVLVRHAAAEAGPQQPAALWPLADEGRAGARALAGEPIWRAIAHIYASPEAKAHETAQIIAGMNGISVSVIEDLREVVRPTGQWFDERHPGGYAGAVADYFAAPSAAVHGWEPAVAAQMRIRSCVDTLRGWQPQPFAVVGHGLTLSLYVAAIAGADAATIWTAIALPDLAVVDPVQGVIVRPFGTWRTPKP